MLNDVCMLLYIVFPHTRSNDNFDTIIVNKKLYDIDEEETGCHVESGR